MIIIKVNSYDEMKQLEIMFQIVNIITTDVCNSDAYYKIHNNNSIQSLISLDSYVAIVLNMNNSHYYAGVNSIDVTFQYDYKTDIDEIKKQLFLPSYKSRKIIRTY